LLSIVIVGQIYTVRRMDSPQSNYLPSPDEIQQMINERLPEGYRIKQDGRVETDTKKAWEYVLTPKENRKHKDWSKFLDTIKTPECKEIK